MFKRCLVFISVLVVLVLGVFGCQKEKTSIDKAQEAIVSVGDGFLNYELTVDEAKEKLDSIVIPETKGNGSLYLEVDKGSLYFALCGVDNFWDATSFEDIKEEVDSIRNKDYNN